MSKKIITWKVEGANWTWTGDFPSSVSPEEVATRVIETMSKPALWDEAFKEGFMVKVGQNPQVGTERECEYKKRHHCKVFHRYIQAEKVMGQRLVPIRVHLCHSFLEETDEEQR